MQPLIEFKNAALGYGRNAVLKDISFSIEAGDYFGLVGPNGSGKTTILRAILGTIHPLAGEVRVHAPSARPIRFGYVPQRDTVDYVLPYTVGEVVLMGRYHQIGLMRLPSQKDREIVRETLNHVDISDLHDRPLKELSGGQKQRVLIARALASEPDILVLDEPTNGMDLSSRISILQLIHSLYQIDRLTIVMVSHLLDDVANYVRRIAIVDRNFFQVGNVDDVLTGENLTTLYQMPVEVIHKDGNKVIIARGPDGIR